MRTSAHCAILRVKSLPRLEPRDIQRLLEHNFAAKRRENASAPQNGILSQTQQGIPPQGFQNHIPARGRKLRSTHFAYFFISIFQNHIPARGRKQINNFLWMFSYFLFQNHIPARGRKPCRCSHLHHPSALFQNHIPARGRKPCSACRVLAF